MILIVVGLFLKIGASDQLGLAYLVLNGSHTFIMVSFMLDHSKIIKSEFSIIE